MLRDLRRRFGPRMILSVGRWSITREFSFLSSDGEGGRQTGDHGEGPMRPALEQEVAALGIADPGDLSRPGSRQSHHYFHAADVFALPSCERSEAFGIVQWSDGVR